MLSKGKGRSPEKEKGKYLREEHPLKYTASRLDTEIIPERLKRSKREV
jgi:hypothetical protein